VSLNVLWRTFASQRRLLELVRLHTKNFLRAH